MIDFSRCSRSLPSETPNEKTVIHLSISKSKKQIFSFESKDVLLTPLDPLCGDGSFHGSAKVCLPSPSSVILLPWPRSHPVLVALAPLHVLHGGGGEDRGGRRTLGGAQGNIVGLLRDVQAGTGRTAGAADHFFYPFFFSLKIYVDLQARV
jgi:hypothetical protein